MVVQRGFLMFDALLVYYCRFVKFGLLFKLEDFWILVETFL